MLALMNFSGKIYMTYEEMQPGPNSLGSQEIDAAVIIVLQFTVKI